MGMFSVERIRALQNAGCDVIVVCPVLITLPARFLLRPRKLIQCVTQQIGLPAETNYHGVPVYYPKWVWFPKGLFGWYSSYFLYRQIRKRVVQLAIDFQPEVILSSWLPDGLAACILGASLGIPIISIADGSDINDLSHRYPGWEYACHHLNSENSTVIFVSKALQGKANSLGLFGGASTVLYNAADTNLFQAGSGKPDNTIFTVLGVGRLVPVKGFHILLVAFARLYRQLDQQARLILVGEGPLRDTLIQQATELGIRHAVDIVGVVPHDKIVSYYQRAHVFCLPSFSEGSPTVIVEAMACGVPVVASQVGGVGEIVNPESGILVPPGDPERLSEALLLARERDWNRSAIRQEVEHCYEWGKWTKEVLNLIGGVYETVVGFQP